jgi:hypothetical protein
MDAKTEESHDAVAGQVERSVRQQRRLYVVRVVREAYVLADAVECAAAAEREKLRVAFWAVYHKSGETFFDYLRSEEECEQCTAAEWQSVVERADEAQQGLGDKAVA